ncbi:MAG: OmpH family outer membrane protein [Lentisphaeria bacterium]|nr:OmpH family outer membrane protein [Lentisphaeria bacterium]
MKKFILLFSAVMTFSMCQAAQKIVTVNIEKLFNSYYKTSQVENIIKKQAQVYQDYLNKKLESVKAIDKKFRVQLDKAQNVTISSADRSAAAKEAEKLSNEIRVIRKEMEVYSNEKRKEMGNMTMRKRQELMQEITACVRKTAEGLGADFVFDVSGRTAHQIPAVIYAKPSTDITNQVLQILNKGNVPEKRK